MKKIKVLKSKVLFKGTKLKLRVDQVQFPHGKGERECVEHGGAVAMVPLLEGNQVILNRQHRYAANKKFWEIPAGTLEKGEQPRVCAKRELIEETGYKAGKLVRLSRCYTTPGYSSEIIYIYLALDLQKVDHNPIGHTEEGIRNKIFPLDKLINMIASGTIDDGKTISGLFLAQHYLTNI